MTKKIFLGLALLAALVSCNKEFAPVATTEDQGKTLVIGATLDPLTKMDYTAQEDGSYKATFLTAGTDAMYAYFVKEADGNKTVLGSVKLTIDLTTLSADKRTANFVAKSAIVPEGATHIYTYFANGGTNTAFGKDSVLVDISAQTSLVNANQHHLISAVSPISDLKESDGSYTLQSVALKYQTALVKFVLTLPEGVKIKAGAETPVVIEGTGIHDTLSFFGKTGGVSKVGKITLTPDADTAATVVTAYGVVFASDNFAGSTIKVWNGSDSYVAEFAPTATIEAGKAYTAARMLKKGAFSIDKWVADEAGSLDWETSGVNSDVAWLTFADNKLSWAENTSGSVREGKATDANGNEYVITQIGPNEVKGNWTLRSKVFPKNAVLGLGTATINDKTIDVTIGNPIISNEELTDLDGSKYTNNIGVKGLYLDAVMDGVFYVDYEAHTYKIGLMFDARKGQHVASGVSGYEYVFFSPGLATTYVGQPWSYSNYPIGTNQNYFWIWLDIDENLSKMSYSALNAQKLTTNNGFGTANLIVGICGLLSSEEVIASSTINKAGTGYDVVYQGNPNNEVNTGLLFVRK